MQEELQELEEKLHIVGPSEKPKNNKGFQYRGKSIFLTYSQCPVPKDDMLEHLKVKAKPDTN